MRVLQKYIVIVIICLYEIKNSSFFLENDAIRIVHHCIVYLKKEIRHENKTQNNERSTLEKRRKIKEIKMSIYITMMLADECSLNQLFHSMRLC